MPELNPLGQPRTKVCLNCRHFIPTRSDTGPELPDNPNFEARLGKCWHPLRAHHARSSTRNENVISRMSMWTSNWCILWVRKPDA